ncbi:18806_t:CDS:1, partial [Gigaspora margarita]
MLTDKSYHVFYTLKLIAKNISYTQPQVLTILTGGKVRINIHAKPDKPCMHKD